MNKQIIMVIFSFALYILYVLLPRRYNESKKNILIVTALLLSSAIATDIKSFRQLLYDMNR